MNVLGLALVIAIKIAGTLWILNWIAWGVTNGFQWHDALAIYVLAVIVNAIKWEMQ